MGKNSSSDESNSDEETDFLESNLTFAPGLSRGNDGREDNLKTNDGRGNNGLNAEVDEREDDSCAVSFRKESGVEASEKGAECDDSEVPPSVKRVLIVVADSLVPFHFSGHELFDEGHDEDVHDGDGHEADSVLPGAPRELDQLSLAEKHNDSKTNEEHNYSKYLRSVVAFFELDLLVKFGLIRVFTCFNDSCIQFIVGFLGL